MMRMATIVCLVLLAVGCEVPGEGAGDVDFAASQTVEGASTLSAMLPLRTYGIGRVNKGESRGCQVRMTRAGADVSVVIWGQEEPRQAAKELATWVFPARAVCTYEELSIQSVRTAVLKCPQADGQTAKVCVSTLDPNLYVSNNLPLRGNPNALSCSMSVPGLAPGQP